MRLAWFSSPQWEAKPINIIEWISGPKYIDFIELQNRLRIPVVWTRMHVLECIFGYIWLYTLTHLYAHCSHTARGTATSGSAGVSLTGLSTRIEELQSVIEEKQLELEQLMQSVSIN